MKIPETVTQIGYRAFAQCRNLVYVSALGNGLTELKNQAFDSDASLNRIDIPESTVTIEDHVFDGCSNVVIYCKSTAYAAEYAIKHNIPVYITDGDNKDGKVLNTEKSYYTTNTMGSSGYVDLIASYELKEEVKEKVSKMQLQFVIPSDMTLLEQTYYGRRKEVYRLYFRKQYSVCSCKRSSADSKIFFKSKQVQKFVYSGETFLYLRRSEGDGFH